MMILCRLLNKNEYICKLINEYSCCLINNHHNNGCKDSDSGMYCIRLQGDA